MLADIIMGLGVIYLIFGGVVASIFVLFDSGTRGGVGGPAGPMDLVRWTGITVGWFPIIAWAMFGPVKPA